MDAEQIQQAIDAGIQSGMEALKVANNLSSITLIFGIVVAFLVVLVMALVIVIVVIVFWYRSQKGVYETSARAVNVANDLGVETAALRASNSAVLENDTIRSKAQTALAQGVEAIASAMERVSATVATMGKSMDTVSAGQTTLNAATMTVSEKINESLRYMSKLELEVRDFVTGLSEQGYDIQKLAQNEAYPTDKTRADVKAIADNKLASPEQTVASTAPQPGGEIPVTGTVKLVTADTPA